MAIVARASLTRSTLATGLVLMLSACSPAPSMAPTAPLSTATSPSASQAATCQGASVAPPAAQPAWADRVFYEIFVRSFQDSNGDGIGDFAGLTSKLDYLNDGDRATSNDLGVTGIWLMPITSSPSYHGYDVTDYTTVEPDYGDRAALDAFLDAAHARGIAVIVDLVINHTSRQHPWFQDALEGGPHRDWYRWTDADPQWPPVAGPNPWHRAPNGEFYYGAFWEGMPDLNLQNPEVTAELERIADFWLDDVGVDGFRIDAAKHLIETDKDHQINTPETLAWLADFGRHVHEGHPDALIVGEVYGATVESSRYVPAVDTTFDFELAGRFLLGIQAGDGPTVAAALDETQRSYVGGPYAGFLTNHDQARVASQLPAPGAARVAATLLLTAPGAPFLYYGEELGLPGNKPDERIRSPMPWSSEGDGAGFTTGTPWEPLEEGWGTRNVAGESGDLGSLLNHYRALLAVRRDLDALRAGRVLPISSSNAGVYAFLATRGAEAVAVIANLGSREITDPVLSIEAGACGLGPPTVAYADAVAVRDVSKPETTAAGSFDAWRPIAALPPYSTVVISFGAISP